MTVLPPLQHISIAVFKKFKVLLVMRNLLTDEKIPSQALKTEMESIFDGN